MKLAAKRITHAHAGFTLMEIAVTIVIVGIGLVYILEGLNTAKFTAAHTHNMKLARELALLTIGQIESGEFQEDIDSAHSRGLSGSYAEQDHPDFYYELLVGDEKFPDANDKNASTAWSAQRARDDERKREQEKDKNKDELTEQPFEKVKIRITFPKFSEFPNELVLERWMPWKQVYGEKDDSGKLKKEKAP